MAADPEVVARFGQLLAERFGLRVEPARLRDLTEVLAARQAATRLADPARYFQHLTDPATAPAELRAIATLVTIGETHFFRHAEHFHAMAELILPDRRRVAAGRPLRVLSAGCSNGEEPYSIAMVLAGQGAPPAEILGVDLNPEALARAKAGRYSEWSMRGVLPAVRQRHFRPASGGGWQLDERILAMASFAERNLAQPDPAFWAPGRFDLIICRNVLIYFTPEGMREVIARFATALAPGGYLILGPSESLRGVSDAFHLLHTHNCFYYQRKGGALPQDLVPAARPEPEPAALVPAAAAEPVDAWAEAIAGAADRIAALATRTAPAPTPPDRSWERVLELARHERFAEALAGLDALPPASARTREALLLRAAILTNAGRVAEAERACNEAIARDDLDPGAHYLLALAREHAGDLTAARRHDEAALYLDPDFAMPHLHLGLMARKQGDPAAARAAFQRALALVPGEPAARLELFGGGFTREALEALCRAQLAGGGA
jgi:chemotaxis protein methyltransferase CheR